MRTIRLLALGAALLVFGSGAMATQALHDATERYTDSAIRADEDAFQALLQRLMAVNSAGVPSDSYTYAKAMHWWELAYDEFTENDRSGIVRAAYAEAARLTDWLEGKGADPGRLTPLLAGSARLREDLWALAADLATAPGGECAQADLARLEVQLVWAGHEYQELGWRHALPYVQEAETLAKAARQAQERCVKTAASTAVQTIPEASAAPRVVSTVAPVEPAASAVIASPQVVAVPPSAPSPEAIAEVADLGQRIYFAYKRAELSTDAQALLDRMADVLKAHRELQVVLRGHADSRGSALYNLQLSLRRAVAVQAYLFRAGVAPDQLLVEALGKSEPAAREETPEAYARNRRVEIVPQRKPEATVP